MDLSKMSFEELNALFEKMSDELEAGKQIDEALYGALARELEARDPLPGLKTENEKLLGKAEAILQKYENADVLPPEATGKARKKTARIALLSAAVLLLAAALVIGAVFMKRNEEEPPTPTVPPFETSSEIPPDTTPSDPSTADVTDVYIPTEPTIEPPEEVCYEVLVRSEIDLPITSAEQVDFELCDEYAFWDKTHAAMQTDLSAPSRAVVTLLNKTYEGGYFYSYVKEFSDHYSHRYRCDDGTVFEISAEDGALEYLEPCIQQDSEPENRYKQAFSELDGMIRKELGARYNSFTRMGKIWDNGDYQMEYSCIILCGDQTTALSEKYFFKIDKYGRLLLFEAQMRGKFKDDDINELRKSFWFIPQKCEEEFNGAARAYCGKYLNNDDINLYSFVLTKLTNGKNAVLIRYLCVVSADVIKDQALHAQYLSKDSFLLHVTFIAVVQEE